MTGQQRSESSKQIHGLPQQLASLVGRERELSEIERQLGDPACRLLTLVGPGGIGKTQLAIHAVVEVPEGLFAGGVYLVWLESLREAQHLARAMADALGLSLSGQDDPLLQLQRHLSDKSVLLVLDNFEHLLDEAGIVGDVLQAAPGVKTLVTSRVALHLREEWLYPVDGLPIPADGSDPENSDAVRLFVDRARRVRPGFDLENEGEGVVRVCQLVEGMPLAIELAAAWTRTLGCAEIVAEIERSMDLLSTSLRDVPHRHRSVQAVFDGSWALLTEDEQNVYERLSVFRGGFQREAASLVTGASLPVLAALVDHSLLQWVPAASTAAGTGGRYQIHELLRQCAEERLVASAERVTEARDVHCTYFASTLASLFDDLLGGRQRKAAAEVAAELENIRAAWLWSLESGRVQDIRAMVLPLSLFYQFRGRYLEGAEALDRAAACLTAMPPSKEVERALLPVRMDQAWLDIRLGRLEQAEERANQCHELYERLSIPHIRGQGTDPLLALGVIALARGDYAAVARHGEGARQSCEAEGHRPNCQLAYYLLAREALTQGDHVTAERYAWQAYATAKEIGDQWFMTYCLNELGSVASAQGDYAAARTHYESSYEMRQELEDPEGMAVALNHLGSIALLQGDSREAGRLFAESLSIYEEIGDRGGLAASLGGLGRSALAQGDYVLAGARFHRALEIASSVRFVSLILALLVSTGELLLRAGGTQRGVQLLAQVLGHPGSEEDVREQAQRLLDQQRHQMDQDLFASASDLGRNQQLEGVVEAVLLDLASTEWQGASLLGRGESSLPVASQPLVEPLTPRELEVLGLIAQGRTNKQIASGLILSVGTVKYYTSHIYGKLGVGSRTQAVARARELGMLD